MNQKTLTTIAGAKAPERVKQVEKKGNRTLRTIFHQ
jgi:hypothetical protein